MFTVYTKVGIQQLLLIALMALLKDVNSFSLQTFNSYMSNQDEKCQQNEISAANLANCAGQPFGASVNYPGDCTRYLVCNCDYPSVKNCPLNTWFDKNFGFCYYKPEVDSSQCEYSALNAGNCAGKPFGEFVNYPGNCSRYLICNSENPAVMACPPGLWFNGNNRVCDYPVNVNRDSCEYSALNVPTIQPTSKACSDIPIGLSPDFCQQNSKNYFHQYVYNCSMYVLCIEDCPQLKECDGTKIYNPALEICDTASDTECNEIPFPNMTTPNVDESSCKGMANNSRISIQDDCQSYVLCRNEEVLLRSCPTARYYNPLLNICDVSEDVCQHTESIADTTTPTTTLTPEEYCLKNGEGFQFANPIDCQAYYLCITDSSYMSGRCSSSHYFNPGIVY